MTGMNAATGRSLADIDHLKQSLRDILTTPLGSRVMRRDYGSRLYQLVDRPVNQAFLVDVFAATAEAVLRWEPRLALERVSVASAADGVVNLVLTGRYLGEAVALEVAG